MIRTLTLLRSLIKILWSPNETSKGARIYFTFNLESFEREYQDFLAEPQGRLIMDGKPSLFDLLTDHESLEQLPEGSVGKTFLDEITRDGVDLVKLNAECEPIEKEILGIDEERGRFSKHVRASHDLYHVLTGYPRNPFGELQLLTFSYQQSGSPAHKWLARYARFMVGRKNKGAQALLDLAAKRGQRTRYLLTADWEDLLDQPLVEVREKIGMGAPPNLKGEGTPGRRD